LRYSRDKKIKGRKRHFFTDAMSLLLAVDVHAEYIYDNKRVTHEIAFSKGQFERLVKIIADGI